MGSGRTDESERPVEEGLKRARLTAAGIRIGMRGADGSEGRAKSFRTLRIGIQGPEAEKAER